MCVYNHLHTCILYCVLCGTKELAVHTLALCVCACSCLLFLVCFVVHSRTSTGIGREIDLTYCTCTVQLGIPELVAIIVRISKKNTQQVERIEMDFSEIWDFIWGNT